MLFNARHRRLDVGKLVQKLSFAGMLWPTLTIVFLIAYACLIFFYWHQWNRLPVYNQGSDYSERKISVIVPARNEEGNINKLLQALSAQTLPKELWEVIVVDDYSSDNTFRIASEFPLLNLQVMRPDAAPELSSKKTAIAAGIKKASGDLIITTDADCIPPAEWLQTLQSFYTEKKAAFIAAPVRFAHDNSFVQTFQALDFLTLQGITAASVYANFHSMCNGANLGYAKQAFLDVNGFEGIDKVATGDDMLLMYKIWKKFPGKVYYLKSKEAIVSTTPMPTWKAFFSQRKRWASKTIVYDDYRIIAVLGFVFALNIFFVALVIAAFFDVALWWLVPGFWMTKAVIEFPFVRSVARFFGEEKLLPFLFLFQPVHMFYTVLVGLSSQFGRYEWKGRKTK